ncbi:hypothetical protein C8Q75DRAFT_737434 [Abortiporus biennis]|nr:hypothetical protein C8Q75DRAFT_737434 [Abortiporus biennis]
MKQHSQQGTLAFQTISESESPSEALRTGRGRTWVRSKDGGFLFQQWTQTQEQGAGLLFGDNGPRNKALMIPTNIQESNQTGELIAIEGAASTWEKGIVRKMKRGHMDIQNAAVCKAADVAQLCRGKATLRKRWI